MNMALEKLKDLEVKYLYLILAGVILFIALVDFFTVMQLQMGLVRGLDTRVAQLNKDINDLTTNKQRLSQFQRQLELAKKQRKNFEMMVYKRDQVPVLLNRLSNLANEQSVKIEQVLPQQLSAKPVVQNEDGKYFSMDISIKLRSGYHQFGKFLNRLEKERLFWQIEQLKIVGDDKDAQRQDIAMQIKILILEK